MKEYSVPIEGQEAILKRSKRWFDNFSMALVLLAAVLCFLAYKSVDRHNEDYTLLFIFGGSAVWGWVYVDKILSKQRALFKTYTITLSDQLVSFTSDIYKPVDIYLQDITGITLSKAGTLCIRGKDPKSLIVIPKEIDRFDELKAALSQNRPVQPGQNPVLSFFVKTALTMGGLGFAIIVFYGKDKVIVSICGALAATILGWNFFSQWKSRPVSNSIGKQGWFCLGIAVAVTVVVVVRWMES
jgi:hypothetical protein